MVTLLAFKAKAFDLVGCAVSYLTLPRILRNTTDILLKSLFDLATVFVAFLGNSISSLNHRDFVQACHAGFRSPKKAV